MKHTLALFAALSVVSASAVLAAPPKGDKKPVSKVTDVWTCPMTGEKITNHKSESGKPEVVGNYRVHFCCAGCPETFAKLSDKDKKEKTAAAVKKDAAPVSKKG